MNFKECEFVNIFDKGEPLSIAKYLEKFNILDYEKLINCNTIEDNKHYENINKVSKFVKNMDINNMFLLVDSDFDGYTSGSIVYKFMKEYKPNMNVNVIHHSENNPKAHGLEDEEVMNFLRNQEPTVLWIPDAGSSNVKQCKELYELGYTIIITDHHKQTSIKVIGGEKCDINDYAMVVNNQNGNVENRNGSGALVTWHCLYDIHKRIANKLICYVMLSLISDSCDMNTYENYTFSYRGKERLNDSINSLVDAFNYKSGQFNSDYSFGMISRCNATIRLGTTEDKDLLFRYLVGEETSNVELFKRMKELHKLQKEKVDEIINELKIEDTGNNFILQEIKDKTALTGLVANKLLGNYGKTIILVHERENGEMAGSVRSNIPNLNSILNDTKLFNYNEGHDKVFGTSYQKENQDEIINQLSAIFASYKPQIQVVNTYRVNSIPTELYDIREHLDELNVCGKGLDVPLIHIEPFEVNGKDIIELGASKTMLKIVKGDTSFILQFMSKEKKEALNVGKNKSFKLEIVGEPQYNIWNDNKYKQVIVKDYEILENNWEDDF